MKEFGLNYILALAKSNNLAVIAIRYIAIIPAEHSVEIKMPIAWRDKLGMYAMRIVQNNKMDGEVSALS